MALLERVATLVRANLNDLIDKAEDPAKMIKQVILDMQNQLLQVKTQVAVALADLHMLEKKQKENNERETEWMRKADLCLEKAQEDLARAAIERAISYKRLQENFGQQLDDQRAQVERLKQALRELDQKLIEAKAKAELLLAQHRRSRAMSKAGDAQLAAGNGSAPATFDRMRNKVEHEEALGQAKAELVGDDIERRLDALQRSEEVDRVLEELKARKK